MHQRGQDGGSWRRIRRMLGWSMCFERGSTAVCVYTRRDSCGCQESGRDCCAVMTASLVFIENISVRTLAGKEGGGRPGG